MGKYSGSIEEITGGLLKVRLTGDFKNIILKFNEEVVCEKEINEKIVNKRKSIKLDGIQFSTSLLRSEFVDVSLLSKDKGSEVELDRRKILTKSMINEILYCNNLDVGEIAKCLIDSMIWNEEYYVS